MVDFLDDAAQAVVHRLAGVSFGLLALALALHLVKLAARSRAWHNIAQAAFPEERLRYRDSVGAYFCGIGANAVLPARSGEVLKLRLIHKKAPATRYQGLASTLLTETIFDVAATAVLLVVGLSLGLAFFGASLPTPLALAGAHLWLVAGAASGLAGVLFLLRHKRPRFAAGGGRGFRVLRRPRRYLTTVASWQLLALGLRAASIFCFLAAFNLPATPRTVLLVIGVQCVADMIPLTPNGAGTQQALLVVALGTSAAGFGAGMQIATAGLEVALGLVSLALMTGSLNWRRALEPAEPAVATSTT